MARVIPSFENTKDLYDKFYFFPMKFLFENNEYIFQELIADSRFKKKLIYRCDKEKHNLIICMEYRRVTNVMGIYSSGNFLKTSFLKKPIIFSKRSNS